MKEINAVGINCPKPVIMTKKEFDSMEEGQVQILADNKPCVMNLEKYAKSNGFEFAYEDVEEDEGDRWLVTITKKAGQGKEESEIPADLLIQDTLVNDKFVVAIGSKYYGTGAEDLGASLMKSFIYTIAESDPLPDSIIFFNSGIELTTKGSAVLDDLKKMADKGVEIVSCGACLDFYQKTEDLEVGEVSNMYFIYETLRDAGRNMIIA